MRIRSGSWLVLLAVAAMPSGCRTAPPDVSRDVTAAVALERQADQAQQKLPAAPDWTGAGDCLDQLILLHDTAAQGRLEEGHAPPFAIAPATPASSLDWVRSTAVPVVADLPLQSYDDQTAAASAAPCLLLVGQPGEVRSAHRVIDFQTVASEYQSGVRSEKNPDYDAAQARLKEAERETKRRGPSVLRVGDPLLDLVGLMVGGVIAAFDHVGSDDHLDDALAALKETPRSRDRPVYRAYEFERSTVRAGKEAAIAVELRDLRRGRIWRSQVRQREMRQLAVLEGLDPRDRDYEQHRAGAMSREEFEHWQRQPPQVPISALITALIENGGEVDRSRHDPELIAEAAPDVPPVDPMAVAEAEVNDVSAPLDVAALAPGAGPGVGWASSEHRASMAEAAPSAPEFRAAWRSGTAAERAAPRAALDPRAASVVQLEAGSRRGNGLYVRPRLVVTAIDLVGSVSVIDVTSNEGESALGLVVHTDPDTGLALVHVPRAGPPALLSHALPPRSRQMVDVLELIGPGQARLTRAMLEGDMGAPALALERDAAAAATSAGAPVFLDDRAVALVAPGGSAPEGKVISIEALDELLESEALAALH